MSFSAVISQISSSLSISSSTPSFFSSLNNEKHAFPSSFLSVSRCDAISSLSLSVKINSLLNDKNCTKFSFKNNSNLNVSASLEGNEENHTKTFLNLTTEEEVFAGIEYEIKQKKLPNIAGPGMHIFYNNYKKAAKDSGVKNYEEITIRIMSTIFDRIMVQFENPFTFPSYHKRITHPYNYYQFGQNFASPLIDYKNSYLGNKHIFEDIQKQIDAGENVLLLSNHQTEADPAVLALLLETLFPKLAEELTYVAGDRVVLDPFCKPFSMGRNLFCVYSKKRINDVPELAAEKMASNRRTLKEMSIRFNNGGMLVWIAPSGGRDRPDPVTDEWTPAAFDSSSVEIMRRMISDAAPRGHIYPLSLICYDIMPPPRSVEKEIGEQRVLNFHGVGLAVAPEIDFESLTKEITDKKRSKRGLLKTCV